MSKTSMTILSGAALLAASLALAPRAFSHTTGHESRTIKACERLPTPERKACLSCVTRPAKHHYHPERPPESRCRPDNDKP